MNTDERYMRLALALARKASGLTNPNPAVGAVIVKNGIIVGRGYHKRCGLPHAEVNAIRQAGRRSAGATMYVTMEPCGHFGRTPPCTKAIIESGIKKVVVGMRDPNPVTNGKGIRKLKAAGIKVMSGLLENDARDLNRPFAKYIRTGMPYVTLKMAESLDGKIASRRGDSKWVSSEESRRFVHDLRGRVDAVMVGVNTLIRDDPSLLSKMSKEKQPARVIVDSRLKSPVSAKIFSSINISPVYIATAKRSGQPLGCKYERLGVKVLYIDEKRGRVDLKRLMAGLGELGIIHVLAEGGGELAAGLIDDGLVDEFLFFVAPKIIGGRDAVTAVEGRGVDMVRDAKKLEDVTVRRCGEDILIKAYSKCSQE